MPSQRSSSTSCVMDVMMEVIGDPNLCVPVLVSLRYEVGEPYAVFLDIQADAGGPITWFFARDLLLAGLHQRSGRGDVAVNPGDGHSSEYVFISLMGVDAAAVLRVRAADIRCFLQQAELVVPAGAEEEYFDVDALIHRLLGHPTP